ncbi:MAG: hypothetical protein HY927_12245 [Elusimicrobia bacterium]|nr:hypothetical protein [Elusimicrobiota bacterium]
MPGLILAAVLSLGAPSRGADGPPAAAAALADIDGRYFNRHRAGNLAGSVESLERLLAAQPDSPEVLWRLGRSLVRVGEGVEKKKDKLAVFVRAQGLLEKAISLDDKNVEAHYWFGVSMGRQGQLRGIFKSLSMVKVMRREMEAVLKLQPRHGGAHHVLGELNRELPGFLGGDKKKSLEELELARSLAPDYTASYGALAEAYLDAGQKGKAVAVCKAVLEVKSPEDPAEFEDNIKEARELLKKLE